MHGEKQHQFNFKHHIIFVINKQGRNPITGGVIHSDFWYACAGIEARGAKIVHCPTKGQGVHNIHEMCMKQSKIDQE